MTLLFPERIQILKLGYEEFMNTKKDGVKLALELSKSLKIYYREIIEIGNYKAIEHKGTISGEKCFMNGNLLYLYTDRYNIKTVSIEDIEMIDILED